MQALIFDKDILTAKICPYCGDVPEYVDSSEVYSKSYGFLYLCRACDAYVGVHNNTRRSLGRLANKELRTAKQKAHKYFDSLWKRKMQQGRDSTYKSQSAWKKQCRSDGYTWLSKELGIPRRYTHIGMFDIDFCEKVVQICKPFTTFDS